MYNIGKRLNWIEAKGYAWIIDSSENYYTVNKHFFANIKKEIQGLDMDAEIKRVLARFEKNERIILGVNMYKDHKEEIHEEQYWYKDEIDAFIMHLVKMNEPIRRISVMGVVYGGEPDGGETEYFAWLAESKFID